MKALPEDKQKELFISLKAKRQVYKKVNYTAVYGAGAATLARAAGVDENTGRKLGEAYWKRNWSVLKIAEDQVVKKVNGQMWLYNPVSQLWYSLRYEKDRFSTLNQGTGVWCFDTWVGKHRKGGPPLVAQFHDEVILLVKKGKREKLTAFINKCQKETNDELKLNRELGCSIDFGFSYADIH